MKKTFLAVLLATLSAGQASAQTNLQELHNELQIMSSILQTSLKQNNDARGIRFRSIGATYLAGQGVVFEVNTSGSSGSFSFDLGEIIGSIPMPVAPISPGGGDGHFEFKFDHEFFEDIDEDAMDEVNESMREARERLRELRERERELSWEQRDYERRRRDLEFEKRNAEGERRKELDEEMQELESESKILESKRAELNKYAAELEAEQKKQTEQRQSALQQQYKRFLAGFENSIGEVLCRYGAGIKAVPEDENISFVLPRFSSSAQAREKQDRIYVFKNKDIRECVKEKITADKLLSKAYSYSF